MCMEWESGVDIGDDDIVDTSIESGSVGCVAQRLSYSPNFKSEHILYSFETYVAVWQSKVEYNRIRVFQ